MTYEQIHTLFKQRYSQSNWKQFLGEAFANTRLLATPEILTGIDSNVASQVQKLGYITLNENGIERQIAVYEVTLAQGIILERNRVGLRNLLRKYWKDIDAAFIAYHRPESPKWRFTYVSELTGYDADGEFVKIKTEPKRYTYVLGEGESTRTAAERFTAIAKLGSQAKLEDVKEAFSVEKLSKAFFDEYKKHYDIFCKFMLDQPGIKSTIFNGDEKGIRDFNKKLLGRIVFLYFIQKKGWLGVPSKSDWGKGDFDFLTNLFKNSKNPDLFYSDLLSKLFFDTLNTKRKDDLIELVKGEPCRIPYLNGGLFEEDDKKHRNLIFPSNLFKSLFDFFNQYNFTIYEDDPNDHTVAVDPEMLGHIFENLLEDNKDKGAYYTPKEIVHYMCQESLIEYLTTYCLNRDLPDLGINMIESEQRQWIESLIKKKESDIELLKKSGKSNESYKSWFRQLNTALDNVKICDPAIGSGAFPMGLLHEIFTAKQTLHHFDKGNLIDFKASDVKLNIIQNSIYGVDIEKGAVDIARLRFWLSLIVDEEKPKALPNLDYKIVVGNSLVSKLGDDIIDIDWTLNETAHGLFGADLAKQKGDLLKKISKEQKDFFNPDSDKKKLAANIRNLKIDLLITQLELMVTTKGIEKKPSGAGKALTKQTVIYLQTIGWKNSIKDLQKLKTKPDLPLYFFDWKLDFPEVMNESVTEKTGFDIVIGNPPYVQLQKIVDSEIFANLNYKVYSKSTDLYCLFYEKGVTLLKEKGNLCYITSNSWLRTKYGLEMRKYFTQNSNPILLINFEDIQIFQTAVVESNIIITEKSSYSKNTKAATIGNNLKVGETISNYFSQNAIYLDELDEKGWIIGNKNSNSLKKKIEKNTVALGNLKYNINIGVNTGLNEVFIIKENLKDELIKTNIKNLKLIVPTLRGRDLKRYAYSFSGNYLINSHNGIKSKLIKPIDIVSDYPSLFAYFKSYEVKLKNRYDQGMHWTNLRNCAYLEDFKKPKIIWGELSDKAKFTLDEEGYYLDATVFLMTGENLKYILSIFNSKLAQWYFEQIATSSGMGTNRWKKYKIEQFPIKVISEDRMLIFESFVNQILLQKSEGKDTTSLEQQIDNLVYKLYELSYDEVKVIDPAFALSEQEYKNIKLD